MIVARYRVRCPAERVEAMARWIAVEQTVEVPEALIGPGIVVGEVVSIEPRGDSFDIEIRYPEALVSGQLGQLLNLVFGNVSIHGAVRLVDLRVPPLFSGPRHGIPGLRDMTGVRGRPLLSTALKPRGAPASRLVEIARGFAEGGGDLVKDDHNLVEGSVGALVERAARIQEAVAHTRCLYAPNLAVPAERLHEAAERLARLGVKGVMVAPLIVGLDTTRDLAARHDLFVIGHPTFSGAFYASRDHGMEPGILLGTLFRLAGVDVSVFTNAGGRFPLTVDECAGIARRLREPFDGLRPAFPAPAGGMVFERIPDLVANFGDDAVLLIGGDLLARGPTVREATAAYLTAVSAPLRS